MKFSNLIAALVFITCVQLAFTQQTSFKIYTYPKYEFSIKTPQVPKEIGVINGTQYLLYEDDDADVSLNLTAVRSTDCSAWMKWASNLAAENNGITFNKDHVLESHGDRNSLQSGYERDQCFHGTTYHFQAGWRKGEPRPEIVSQVADSFRLTKKTH